MTTDTTTGEAHELIEAAARLSTMPEFSHIESPLILAICQAYERTRSAPPAHESDTELLEEYERAKEEARETCRGAHNSYGCGYDSGYREGIRFALHRGKADGK